MRRAAVALLPIIFLLSSVMAQTSAPASAQTQPFHFVRPFHRVQEKRLAKHGALVQTVPFRPWQKAAADSPEVTLGERLFMDTRFSQFFAARYDQNVNHPLAQGDPVVETIDLRGKQVKGPFASRSMNCRSCHFIGEFAHEGNGYQRAYSDFAQRSPVPAREDGATTTPRNSMSMVDSFVSGDGEFLLHADGEFASTATLLKSTMTGRNYGWLPSEHEKAVAHIAKVIREDDGTDAVSRLYGGSYAKVFAGTDASIPASLRLPEEFRIDVTSANDQQVLDAIGKVMTAYLESLSLSRDRKDVHDGSPYDVFLKLNNLPASTAEGESDAQYSARLSQAVADLKEPKFVDQDEQLTWFQYHQQKFAFGPLELKGLKIFLSTQQRPPEPKQLMTWVLMPLAGIVVIGVAGRRTKERNAVVGLLLVVTIPLLGGWKTGPSAMPHVGNCVTCHSAPDFTDRRFHNNGAAQEEYDAINGAGSFAQLRIPSYDERQRAHDKYLPATPQHPLAAEIFRKPPTKNNSQAADLGMWNIYANPDFPEPQSRLTKLLCSDTACKPDDVLPRTLALFRTPTLRDLGDSAPYMHTGRFDSIEDVLRYYMSVSELARKGRVRNGAPELQGVTITGDDIPALAAFLRSLNEDYD